MAVVDPKMDIKKWWNENRWRVTESNLRECSENLSYAANPEEMEYRKKVLELCRQIAGEIKRR
jgi:hypothetical protein